MAYQPDPDTWPARIADIVTRVRARLRDHQTVEDHDIVHALTDEAGLPKPMDIRELAAQDPEAAVRVGEIEYLVYHAFRQMEADGEIVKTLMDPGYGTGGAKWIGELARSLGWQKATKGYNYSIGFAYEPAVRLRATDAAWTTSPTRWPNVDRLAGQSLSAHRHGLDVAAAVTARVAVEEAVQQALSDLGEATPADKPWSREDQLFDSHLTSAGGFSPLDRTATRAALSVVRDRGNDAAHTGRVDHALLQETLALLLPQALGSLSLAVTAKVSP